MPVDVRYERDGALVRIVGRGVITDEEFIRVHTGLFESEEHARHYRAAISDWTLADAQDLPLTHKAIQGVARIIHDRRSVLRPDLALAIVTVAPVQFGQARQFAAYVDESGLNIRLFADLGEAERWVADHLALPDANGT